MPPTTNLAFPVAEPALPVAELVEATEEAPNPPTQKTNILY